MDRMGQGQHTGRCLADRKAEPSRNPLNAASAGREAEADRPINDRELRAN